MANLNKLPTSKFKNILNCANELDALLKNKNIKNFKKAVERLEDCVLRAIAEIAHNCLRGNIPLNKCQFKKLQKHQSLLRNISANSSVQFIRKKLKGQKGQQLLSVLLPSALSFLFSVVGPYLEKKFSK